MNMTMIMTTAKKLLRRNLLWAAALALIPTLVIVAQPPQQTAGKDLSWAFPVPSKDQPKEEDTGPRHIPGSTKAFTQAQIDDLFNPPVWFPDQYASAPPTVVHGKPPDVPGCGSCHLMSGMGHAESSQLAGLSSGYIVEQMNNFKSGDRKGAIEKLKLSDMSIDVTMAVLPLEQTITSVRQATDLINSGKYYEASQVLRQAQDNQRFDGTSISGTPSTTTNTGSSTPPKK